MSGGPAGLLRRLPSFDGSIHGVALPEAWDGYDLASTSRRGVPGVPGRRAVEESNGRDHATTGTAWTPPLSAGSEADTLPDGRRGGTRTRPPPRRPAPTPRAHARRRSAPCADPIPGEAGPGSLSSRAAQPESPARRRPRRRRSRTASTPTSPRISRPSSRMSRAGRSGRRTTRAAPKRSNPRGALHETCPSNGGDDPLGLPGR